MKHEAMRLARPGRGGGPRNAVVLGSATYSEDTFTPSDIQARRIADRFRVPLDMARVVASLAFGEVRA